MTDPPPSKTMPWKPVVICLVVVILVIAAWVTYDIVKREVSTQPSPHKDVESHPEPIKPLASKSLAPISTPVPVPIQTGEPTKSAPVPPLNKSRSVPKPTHDLAKLQEEIIRLSTDDNASHYSMGEHLLDIEPDEQVASAGPEKPTAQVSEEADSLQCSASPDVSTSGNLVMPFVSPTHDSEDSESSVPDLVMVPPSNRRSSVYSVLDKPQNFAPMIIYMEDAVSTALYDMLSSTGLAKGCKAWKIKYNQLPSKTYFHAHITALSRIINTLTGNVMLLYPDFKLYAGNPNRIAIFMEQVQETVGDRWDILLLKHQHIPASNWVAQFESPSHSLLQLNPEIQSDIRSMIIHRDMVVQCLLHWIECYKNHTPYTLPPGTLCLAFSEYIGDTESDHDLVQDIPMKSRHHVHLISTLELPVTIERHFRKDLQFSAEIIPNLDTVTIIKRLALDSIKYQSFDSVMLVFNSDDWDDAWNYNTFLRSPMDICAHMAPGGQIAWIWMSVETWKDVQIHLDTTQITTSDKLIEYLNLLQARWIV